MDSNDELLDRRLEDIYRVEPPEALRARLLAIAAQAPASTQSNGRAAAPARGALAWLGIEWPLRFEWRLAVPAVAVAAAVAVMWAAGTRPGPDTPLVADSGAPLASEQQQAVRDFVIVMNYLQAASARAHRGVQGEIGDGLVTAFNRGEQSFTQLSNEITNGG